MVEQFGLAIILSFTVNLLALISGTISFLFVSIRQADELSTTKQPASTNLGAKFSEAEPPAENRAMSGFLLIAFSAEINLYSVFL